MAAEIHALPEDDGAKVVTPDPAVRLPDTGRTLPETPVKDQATGTPSGIKIPPAAVSVPAEVRVIFTRTAEVWDVVTDDGDAEMFATSQGSYVTGPFTRAVKSGLFAPHQVSVAVRGLEALIA